MLQVPGLTADDVADFLDAADRNRDGLIDYQEYVDYLTPDKAMQEDDDEDESASPANAGAIVSSSASVENEVEKESKVIDKVPPYNADEIREVLAKRQQKERALAAADKARRDAYREALDIKIFEEELEASKKRKGGGNPRVSVEETSGVAFSDYNFIANKNPLRFSASGSATFLPIHFETSYAPKARDMLCTRAHELTDAGYDRWGTCRTCKKTDGGGRFYCYKGDWPNQCDFCVCKDCKEEFRSDQEKDALDPQLHPTFLRCASLCSFTLQIPMSVLPQPATGKFSVTLEMRVLKLPVKGQLQTLLRFSQPDPTRGVESLHRYVYCMQANKCVNDFGFSSHRMF